MDGLALELSPLAALGASAAISVFFVASLHLWKLAGYADENRNHTGTIQRRCVSTLLSCSFSALLVYLLSRPAATTERGLTLLELLGLTAEDPAWSIGSCLLLTASLFAGPIAQHAADVVDGNTGLWQPPSSKWIALRDLCVAPITEEFVFRACLIRLWTATSFSTGVIVFCSPLCFSLAHTHHFVEHVRRFEDKQVAFLQVAFQVFYTSLFGMYASFLLVRVGSTVALILTHAFCNHQGFPDVAFLVSPSHRLHAHRLWLAAAYLLGIVAFSLLLMPMTEAFSSNFGPGGVTG